MQIPNLRKILTKSTFPPSILIICLITQFTSLKRSIPSTRLSSSIKVIFLLWLTPYILATTKYNFYSKLTKSTKCSKYLILSHTQRLSTTKLCWLSYCRGTTIKQRKTMTKRYSSLKKTPVSSPITKSSKMRQGTTGQRSSITCKRKQ